MSKFIIYDGPDMPLPDMPYLRGDVISSLDDHEQFGTDELGTDLFACIEVPDMNINEARSRVGTFIPDSTGRYIERPSLYWLDLDDVIGVERTKRGTTVISKGTVVAKFKVRDPLLNPAWRG